MAADIDGTCFCYAVAWSVPVWSVGLVGGRNGLTVSSWLVSGRSAQPASPLSLQLTLTWLGWICLLHNGRAGRILSYSGCKPLFSGQEIPLYINSTCTQVYRSIYEEISKILSTFKSFLKCVCTAHVPNEKDAMMSCSLARKEVLHATCRMVAN